jgi:hypothetical protein
MCKHPNHNPPQDAITAGLKKWTCPLCGAETIMGVKSNVESYKLLPPMFKPSGMYLKDLDFTIPIRHTGVSG